METTHPQTSTHQTEAQARAEEKIIKGVRLLFEAFADWREAKSEDAASVLLKIVQEVKSYA